jgi:hypothetical protein
MVTIQTGDQQKLILLKKEFYKTAAPGSYWFLHEQCIGKHMEVGVAPLRTHPCICLQTEDIYLMFQSRY